MPPDDELVKNLQPLYKAVAKNMLNAIAAKAPNAKQKATLIEIIETVAEKSGQRAMYSLNQMNQIIKNPNFKLSTLDFIKMLAEKSEQPEHAIWFLSVALQNKNFKPEALNEEFITKLCAIVSAISQKAGKDAELALSHFNSAMLHPNFKVEMLDDVSVIIEKSDKKILEGLWCLKEAIKNRADYSLSCFKSLCENHNFKPETLQTIKKIIEKATQQTQYPALYILESFEKILKNNNFKPEILDILNLVVEKGQGRTDQAAYDMAKVIESSNFDSGLLETINGIVEKDPDGVIYALGQLAQISNSTKFRKEMIEPIKAVIEKTDRLLDYALWNVGALLKNPNFTVDMLNVQVANTLSENFNLIVNSNEKTARDILPCFNSLLENPGFKVDIINAEFTGSLSEIVNAITTQRYALLYLNSILKNKNFKPGLLAAMKMLIDNAKKNKNEDYISYSLNYIDSTLKNSNFKPELLETIKLIAEKSTEDVWSLWLLTMVIKNRNFKPELLGKEFTDRLYKVVNFAFEKSGNRAKDALLHMGSVLKNPNFKQETFSEEFAEKLCSNVNLVFTKAGERDAGTILYYLGILAANKNFTPDMFIGELSDKLCNLVKIIVENSQHETRSPFWFIERIIKNPEIKPATVNNLQMLAEKSGKDIINTLWLFGAILENPNTKIDVINQQFVDAVCNVTKFTLTTLGEEKFRAFYILPELARNPNFKQEMLTKEYAKKVCDTINLVFSSTGDQTDETLAYTRRIVGNKNFNFEMLGIVNFIIEKTNRNAGVSLSFLNLLLEQQNFKPEMLDIIKPIVEKIDKKADYAFEFLAAVLENKNFESETINATFVDKLASLFKFISGIAGNLDAEVLLVLSNAAKNPNLTQEMLNEDFAGKLYDAVNTIFEKNVQKEKDSLGFLYSVIKGPNFVNAINKEFSNRLCSIVNLVFEKQKKATVAIKPPLWYLNAAVSNVNFKPEMLTEDFATKLFETVDSVFSKSSLNPDTVIWFFEKILRNINFNPTILNEEFAAKTVETLNFAGGLGTQTGQTFALNSLFLNSNIESILSLPADYEKAKEFAKSTEAEYENPAFVLNFYYGGTNIGDIKAKELHNALGLEYFARYTVKTLDEVHQNLGSTANKKPVLLVVFNKNDHNGAFYSEGTKLEALTKYYKLLIAEAENEHEFYSKISSIEKKYGKIDTLIIGGHGEADSILLGMDKEEGRIDLTDEEEISQLQGHFISKPTIILVACSTGRNEGSIGALLSRALKADLFAPTRESSETNYHLDAIGKIVDVTYSVKGRIFKQ
ncbi:hypothetical protein J4450_03350 [Candidatus Micrarchaeota archaeon]|nr:hypothetical protein [Candidatus Micrarchaeota archaeon]